MHLPERGGKWPSVRLPVRRVEWLSAVTRASFHLRVDHQRETLGLTAFSASA